MERKDLLAKNAGIFKQQGKILDQIASKDVKVSLTPRHASLLFFSWRLTPTRRLSS